MRCARNTRWQLGRRRIRDIRMPADTGDDLPAALPGFQQLRVDRGFRRAVFRILNQKIHPKSDRRQGRPGMGPLSILIPDVRKSSKRIIGRYGRFFQFNKEN